MPEQYNVYRGKDGEIDYDTVVATMAIEASQVSIPNQDLQPDTIWYYVRRRESDCELESPPSDPCIVRIDSAGDMIGLTPNEPQDVTVEKLSGGRLRIRWRYTTLNQEVAPTGFKISIGESSGDWVLPTNHNDPDSGWANEENAYDGDINSDASCNDYNYGKWLELLLDSPAYCEKVRLYPGRQVGIVIEVHYCGGNWVEVYDSSDFTPSGWNEVAITAGPIDKARIKTSEEHYFDLMEFEFKTCSPVLIPYKLSGNGEYSWTSEPLTDGQQYRFLVRSYKDGAGESQNESFVSSRADATGPSAITGLKASWEEI